MHLHVGRNRCTLAIANKSIPSPSFQIWLFFSFQLTRPPLLLLSSSIPSYAFIHSSSSSHPQPQPQRPPPPYNYPTPRIQHQPPTHPTNQPAQNHKPLTPQYAIVTRGWQVQSKLVRHHINIIIIFTSHHPFYPQTPSLTIPSPHSLIAHRIAFPHVLRISDLHPNSPFAITQPHQQS